MEHVTNVALPSAKLAAKETLPSFSALKRSGSILATFKKYHLWLAGLAWYQLADYLVLSAGVVNGPGMRELVSQRLDVSRPVILYHALDDARNVLESRILKSSGNVNVDLPIDDVLYEGGIGGRGWNEANLFRHIAYDDLANGVPSGELYRKEADAHAQLT